MKSEKLGFVEATAIGMNYDAKRRQEVANRTPANERTYSKRLMEMGRKSYFEEYFNGIKVENQVFAKVGPFEDPKETKSFKMGYKRGSELITAAAKIKDIRLIPEEYQNMAQHKLTK